MHLRDFYPNATQKTPSPIQTDEMLNFHIPSFLNWRNCQQPEIASPIVDILPSQVVQRVVGQRDQAFSLRAFAPPSCEYNVHWVPFSM